MANLTVETLRPGIALVTLRRPDRLNALTWEMVTGLRDTMRSIGEDADVRVVILTGEGRGFCAGIDLNQGDGVGTRGDVPTVYRRQEWLGEMAMAIHTIPQPVIAAVNGPAAGGGMALALACDVRVCAPTAKFVASFIRVGLSAGDVGVSHALPRLVGFGLASEIMLTGRAVEAEEALRIGLANRVVEPEQVLDSCVELAEQMAANSPWAVKMTKQVLLRNVDAAGIETAIELEHRTQILSTRTEDMTEALSAFMEKRPARYSGR